MIVGVYKISSPSGKIYVGMTMTSFEGRWKNHLKDLKRGAHKCRGLQRAFNKYGSDNLVFEIVESWEQDLTNEEMILKKEQDWWDHFVNLGVKTYNGRPTGTGSVFHTEESRLRLSTTIQEKFLQKYNTEVHLITKDARGRKSIKLSCELCEKDFFGSPKRKFCSRSCSSKNNRNNNKIDTLDIDLLQKLYSEDRLSIPELCETFSVKKTTMYGLIKKYDIIK